MNSIEVVINIDQVIENQILNIDSCTSIKEIISFIEENYFQGIKQNLIWQAFSQTIEKLVPMDYQLKIQNEILNFTFEKIENITTDGEENQSKKTNDGNQQQEKICKIISVDQNHNIKAEFPNDSLIKDVLLYIKSKLNISEDIERWVCYEYKSESQLELNLKLQDVKEMIIEVTTIISLSQMKKFKQENFHINLEIYLTKERVRKNFKLPYSSSKTLKDLELLILRFANQQQQILNFQLTKDGVKVNLIINDQQYNTPEIRNQTFTQLNIFSNTLIQATVLQTI